MAAIEFLLDKMKDNLTVFEGTWVNNVMIVFNTTRKPFGGTESGASPCVASRAMAMSSKRILVSEVA